MNSSEKKISILDRIESFGERIGLIQKVTPLVEGDELENLKAKGEPVWPVPLTLDHSHVFAHCIELQFEDEEDADQFFAMYSDAMGSGVATGGLPTVLSAEDISDLEQARRDLQCLNLSTASIDAILARHACGQAAPTYAEAK